MAKSTTPRLGLSLFSADTDNHGGRGQHNEDHQTLEGIVAAWAGKGLLSARPSAGVEGRFWVSTNQGDGGRLSVDLGNTWLDISTLGGYGPPPPVDIGGTGSEGTSLRGMRADARPSIPLATPTQHGAMASQDKELVDSANTSPTAWSLTLRDSSGRINTANPVSGTHAVNWQHLTDRLGGSTVPATWDVVPYALVKRGGDSRFLVADPAGNPRHAANARYVDSKTSRREWKTNIEDIPYGLDELSRVELWAWEYREDAPATGEGLGPMVEDVAEHMPRLVENDDTGVPERVRDRDMLWVVARAVQELDGIRELEAQFVDHLIRRDRDKDTQIAHLDREVRRLKSTVADLVRIVNDLTDDEDES